MWARGRVSSGLFHRRIGRVSSCDFSRRQMDFRPIIAKHRTQKFPRFGRSIPLFNHCQVRAECWKVRGCKVVRWSRNRGSTPAEDASSKPSSSETRTAGYGWTRSHQQTRGYFATSTLSSALAITLGNANLPPNTPIPTTSTSLRQLHAIISPPTSPNG